MKKIIHQGTTMIDMPAASIYSWAPGEVREVPEQFAEELLARGDFVIEQPRPRKKSE